MRNYAAAKKIVRLADRPSEIGPLSDDAILHLVDSFYAKVREDEVLSPVFEGVITDNWPAHLEKMYAFWQTILLDEHTYFGSPFIHHAKLPIGKEHFTRWLQLFYQTIEENFSGAKATEAIWRAAKMAEMFQAKLASYNNTNMKPIV